MSMQNFMENNAMKKVKRKYKISYPFLKRLLEIDDSQIPERKIELPLYKPVKGQKWGKVALKVFAKGLLP